MDLGTFLGLASGIALVLGAIFMGGTLTEFVNGPSIMIVVGGTLASICVAYPMGEVRQAFAAMMQIFSSRKVRDAEVVNMMVRIAEISRREGLIALENIHTENAILKKACQLIADNADPALIRDTVRIEIGSMKRRHAVGEAVFKSLAGYAPSFGMIGTLIGLVQMLTRLNDPKTLGPAMAVAIITTFYGSMMSTLFFLPVAGKLRARTLNETLQLEIIFEGAKCILENNNPRLVYEKLSSFIAPRERRYERR
ncbi:MotA/TolQ/ExbB proton channel family protein [Desulfovibrio sp. JY]|uniref:MotA/TolQ/ExbB proton channel n=1 Tax=Solidesulfovibrio fructosivorans JJ] TaxID=596151 RepID=E1JZG2_SOLFR|nr:MotA/TolQ/ExbB proton channel family protein [Solidesulfovibrio fructosivorans]EFL50209.1 MotA/TolQ/ExbB proton channel [Solidesulfovibrio fructosivorans JJ]]UJX41387.1 MotA/TolQ/ExbB proton channel family protein [Desulfovibrio sp. JY]